MSPQDLRTVVLRRLRAVHDSDRGSLPMLMMVIIATAALGAIMLSTVISQTRTSRFVQSRVGSLQAAQSGIDYALSQLRAATSDSGDITVGDDKKLPCGAGDGVNPSWTNQIANNDATATYTVSIAYYSVDPSTLSNDDLTKIANGKLMKCTSAGPYNLSSRIRTPRYALITSTGRNGSGNAISTGRTLQTTYNFQVLDQNIAGGQIRLYPASSTQANQWCMDAGATPAAGMAVTLQVCSPSNPPVASQVWQYRSDLSIELVSSVTNPKTAGLCLDTGSSPTAHTAGDPMLLEQCAVADSSVCPSGSTPSTYAAAHPNATCSVSPWNQQWSVDDNAHLEGALTDQSDIDKMCINAAAQTAGTALNLATCAGGTTDPKQTFVPSPTTGGGMSGAGNQQLVNFQQFATCLDVTGQVVTSPYMILYTCKQNPNPAKVAFNQKFIPSPKLAASPTKVLITVVKDGTTYCLQSPQSVGGYPVLVQQGSTAGQCPASVAAAGSTGPFVWTMSQRYSDDNGTIELPYANRYTIKDSSATPLCLSPGASNDLLNNAYYKAVMSSCNGSTAQKWNANASLAGATLTNTTELTGTAPLGG